MKTLTIKDLARTEELDRTALSAVRGGMKMDWPSYKFGDIKYAPSYDSSIDATQDLAQFQTVKNSVADGSAFVDNLHVTNNTSLFGQNNIVQH
jgi:chromosome condensin MukBEF complex kleisin-like MukF subunit